MYVCTIHRLQRIVFILVWPGDPLYQCSRPVVVLLLLGQPGNPPYKCSRPGVVRVRSTIHNSSMNVIPVTNSHIFHIFKNVFCFTFHTFMPHFNTLYARFSYFQLATISQLCVSRVLEAPPKLRCVVSGSEKNASR